MTGVSFLTLAAVAAILLGAIAHVRHGPRWRCECGREFADVAALDAHLDDVGRCPARSDGHSCSLPGHDHTRHRCACGLEWS